MSAGATRFRIARAYGVTFRVLASYLALRLQRPFLGSALYEARLIDTHRRNARRVERAIVRLGGLFVKVGQLISILTNFLPEEFRRELEGLQDALPPRPLDEIVSRIRRDLGREPSELFATFETKAMASASLAQVHGATLHDGRRVAVKVQHIDIEQIVPLDLRAIRRILMLVQWFTRVRGLESYHAEISQMIAEELDFGNEAANIERIAARFGDDPAVRFPTVVRELSTRRVLTTGFMPGTKVTNLAELEAKGIDRTALAERVLRAYCQMIFVDGVYHADPHPGNIIVQDDGGVAFVDFGAVGHLSPAMKEGIPTFLEGVIRRDTEKIVAALRTMGFVARDRDPADIAERAIEYFQHRFLDEIAMDSWSLGEVQVDLQSKLEMMTDLRRLDISFRQLTDTFQVPKDWVLLERTLLLLLGLCTHLDPALNPMRTIQPYLEEFVLGRERDWKKLIRGSAKDVMMAAMTIPGDLSRLLARANKGELEIRVPDIREAAELVYVAGRQLVYAVLAIGSGSLAVVAAERGWTVTAVVMGGVCGVIVLMLVGSMWWGRS